MSQSSPLIPLAPDVHGGHPAHLVVLPDVIDDPDPAHLEEGARPAAGIWAQPGRVRLQLEFEVASFDVQDVDRVVEGEDVEDILAGDLA